MKVYENADAVISGGETVPTHVTRTEDGEWWLTVAPQAHFEGEACTLLAVGVGVLQFGGDVGVDMQLTLEEAEAFVLEMQRSIATIRSGEFEREARESLALREDLAES